MVVKVFHMYLLDSYHWRWGYGGTSPSCCLWNCLPVFITGCRKAVELKTDPKVEPLLSCAYCILHLLDACMQPCEVGIVADFSVASLTNSINFVNNKCMLALFFLFMNFQWKLFYHWLFPPILSTPLIGWVACGFLAWPWNQNNHCTTGGYIQSIPSPCSSHSSIRDWTWVAGAESLTIVLPRIIWHQLSNHYTINSEALSLSGIVAQKSVLLTASKSLNRSDLGCLPCRVCLSLRNFVDILLLVFRSSPTSINSAGRLLGYYFWLGYLWQMAKIIIKNNLMDAWGRMSCSDVHK